MAFSFVVETGIGDSDANSYTEVEFADDYISTNSYASTQWDTLSVDTKQKLLARASKVIDARIIWNGERVDEDSGLRWPRSGVYDRDGFLIPDDVIPIALQEAVAEFASYLMTTDYTAPRSANQFKEIQVGPIDIKYDLTYEQGAFPDIIAAILEGLGRLDSGKKPGFKKVIRT